MRTVPAPTVMARSRQATKQSRADAALQLPWIAALRASPFARNDEFMETR